MQSPKSRKENEPEGSVAMLVLERGAIWPAWADELRFRAQHSLVEQQGSGEQEEEFLLRLQNRVRRLAEHKQRLVAVGYVCAPRGAAVSPSARARVSRKLLAALGSEGEPEFILGGVSARVPSSDHDDLLLLWAQLSLERPKTTVSVRFEEASELSGTVRESAARSRISKERHAGFADLDSQVAYGPVHRVDELRN